MTNSLKSLIGKLNDTCRQAAQRAASLSRSMGHYEVDLEHIFVSLLEDRESDFSVVARRCGVDADRLEADLRAELKEFKNGNIRVPVFSPHLPTLLEHAWLIASLESHLPRIRSAHLLLALLTEPDLAQLARRSSKLFGSFPLEELKHHTDKVTFGSREAEQAAYEEGASASGDDAGAADPALELTRGRQVSKTPALDQYTVDLTQRAREGKIDPVIGRDTEIRQVIDILLRRRQNNPILTGEAGVGKTAVVEGLAARIAAADVPQVLQNVQLRTLDMGLLQAGASVKGEFENRLKNVVEEVRKSPVPIILFIDEAHTMIGAGGGAGQSDAANLLKPALARGELRTIAATTWSEYKKYFEKDAALARRFQVVKVEEPDEALASAMLRGMVPLMEKHFGVRILDEAVTEAVRLSHRYISGRQLPDKCVGVLDTACARVALGQGATPAPIEETSKRLERLSAEIDALEREAAAGSSHAARLESLYSERTAMTRRLASLRERLEKERALVVRIVELRKRLEQRDDAAQPNGTPRDLEALQEELQALQGEEPLVPVQVDGHVAAEVVAAWTGIPLGKMVKDEIKTVLNLKELLGSRVIGQSHALEAVVQRVRTARANLEDPHKPKGVFLFVGPSGVGKTETALALADILYGGERKLITINMSEYQEAHTVSGLKGSPPGYVGYGEGGVLTEAVRRNPYGVVLLDEVEKAHPDVLELFYRIFDKGVLDDAEGREIDFRNTLIILTSNVGSSHIMQACLNKPAAERPDVESLTELLRPQLYKAFKPAFLGRLKVVPYYPIADDVLAEIIELKLGRIRDQIRENHAAQLNWSESLVEAVLARCTEVDSGARNVDHILSGTLLPEIAEVVLTRMATGEPIASIDVTADEQGAFSYEIA